jgi:hypothetical protein
LWIMTRLVWRPLMATKWFGQLARDTGQEIRENTTHHAGNRQGHGS